MCVPGGLACRGLAARSAEPLTLAPRAARTPGGEAFGRRPRPQAPLRKEGIHELI